MGSLTGKFSKGILDDFIFKAAVWRTGCSKSPVLGIMKQAMETQRHQRTFVKVASLEKSLSFFPLSGQFPNQIIALLVKLGQLAISFILIFNI